MFYSPSIITLAITFSTISKDNLINILPRVLDKNLAKGLLCAHPDCDIKPISRCSKCYEYYCYNHTYGHIHTMENFEIL